MRKAFAPAYNGLVPQPGHGGPDAVALRPGRELLRLREEVLVLALDMRSAAFASQ
jgi:hypothetical protein